jgi:hypothetical protein
MVAESGHSVADELAADPILRREPMGMNSPQSDLSVRRDSQIRRAPNGSGLYDVLDLILDKGIVVDAFVRVSLVGIELLTVDLRVVIASVDTYLRYAEGVERLQVYNRSGSKRLPDMVGGGMKTQALKKGAEKVGDALGGGDDDDEQEDKDDNKDDGIAGTITHGLKRGIGKLMGSITGGGSDDDEGDQSDEGEEDGQDEGGEEAENSGRNDKRRPEREPARRNGNPGAGRSKSGSRR